MALIKCPECGKDVSDAAATCVHCGFSLKKEKRKQEKANRKPEDKAITAIIITAAIIIALVCCFSFVLFKHDWNVSETINTVSEGKFSCFLGHKWQEATCTSAKYCLICDTVVGEPLEHDWQDATCTEPIHCSRCSEIQGEALSHTTRMGYCDNCGEFVCELLDESNEILANIAEATYDIGVGMNFMGEKTNDVYERYIYYVSADTCFGEAKKVLENTRKLCQKYDEFSKLDTYIWEWIMAFPNQCTGYAEYDLDLQKKSVEDFADYTGLIGEMITDELNRLVGKSDE